MKMTKEEAIAQIEKLKSYCEYMKDSGKMGHNVFDLDVQALDFVLSALTPPNEPLTCKGCVHEINGHENCNYCIRAGYLSDYYCRRTPEGEEEA